MIYAIMSFVIEDHIYIEREIFYNMPCSIEKRNHITIGTLSCVFGIGSWIAMNGIWVELPNLINNVPEGWKLASYLTIITQFANIGPIVYGILKRTVFKRNKERFQHVTIYTIVTFGVVGCICLGLFWKQTTYILNASRSTALLSLTFLVALVDCTSSVTFLPFMSVLPAVYMSPFYVGENLSGLLPALVALGQGVEEYKYIQNNTLHFTSTKVLTKGLRFSQNVFFIFLGLMMVSCLVAYILLNHLPLVINIPRSPNAIIATVQESRQSALYNASDIESENNDLGDEGHPLIPFQYNGTYPRSYILKLLAMMLILNVFQNGFISAIGSYTYAPYGDLAYHLAATLGSIAAAVSCLLFLFFPYNSGKVIQIGFLCYTLTVILIITIAVQSPTPWLYQNLAGKVLIVILAILSSSFVSYTKLAIASVMRDCGHQFLFYTGVAIQIGSFVGAMIMFPVVNYTNIFNST